MVENQFENNDFCGLKAHHIQAWGNAPGKGNTSTLRPERAIYRFWLSFIRLKKNKY
jgi:hypothetical protein